MTVEEQIQLKLSQAGRLLYEVAELSEASSVGELDFMGLVFEPQFGWFSRDGALQMASEWNASECVIGSMYAEGYGMHGWTDRKFGPLSYPDGAPDTDK